MMERNVSTPSHAEALLSKRMLVGASIALVLIIVFLLKAGDPDPAWGKFYFIRPLIIVPLAGAGGGLFYHLTEPFRRKGGWTKWAAIIASAVVYIIGFWMGFVLGLDGTYWN